MFISVDRNNSIPYTLYEDVHKNMLKLALLENSTSTAAFDEKLHPHHTQLYTPHLKRTNHLNTPLPRAQKIAHEVLYNK